MLRFKTTEGNLGSVHTLMLDHGLQIKLVSPELFERAGDADSVTSGEFYRLARASSIHNTLLLSSHLTVEQDAINKDDCWHRRRDVWRLLAPHLPGDQRSLANPLPIAIVTQSYLFAMPGGASVEDVLRLSITNTQTEIDKWVDRYLAGEKFDSAAYLSKGVLDPAYRHSRLFAWNYIHQAVWMVNDIGTRPGSEFTVLDIGTGAGHFLLTLARLLEARNLLSRVRLCGCDRWDTDMRHGSALMSKRTWNAEFFHLDLTDRHALDLVRQRSPDFIVLNHVLEHLEGPLENRWLHDLVYAAKVGVALSVPLNDTTLASELCEHELSFTSESIAELRTKFPIRCAGAVEALQLTPDSDDTGLLMLRRTGNPTLGSTSIPIKPVRYAGQVDRDDMLMQDLATGFDLRRFQLARRAVQIGQVPNPSVFSRIDGFPRQVRQLVVKTPGDRTVYLPDELSQFADTASLIVSHNATCNPWFDQAWAYVNCYRGYTNPQSYRGLSLQVHGDQMRGLASSPAPLDWSYICSSDLPTTFFEQQVDMTDLELRWNLGEQVDLYDGFRSLDLATRYWFRNFAIVLLSPYVLHAATNPVADAPVPRVFFKLCFSPIRFFDNRELRRHAMIDVSWNAEPTVSFNTGGLCHGHWNERLSLCDLQSDAGLLVSISFGRKLTLDQRACHDNSR